MNRFACCALLALGLAGLGQSAGAQSLQFEQTRIDPASEHEVKAYLTWVGSTGGITWNPDAVSPDPGGPPAEGGVASYRYRVGNYVGITTGGPNPFGDPSTDFDSAAVPRTLYLNVSRYVRLHLFLNFDCPYALFAIPGMPRVELRAGTSLLAGSMPEFNRGEGTPSGTWCEVIYAFPTETDRLEAGLAFKLRLIHSSQEERYQYGLAGNHRSYLVFPVYSPEDTAARVPDLPATTGGATHEGSAGPFYGAWPIFLGLLGAGRRRSMTLLVVTAALSGCTAVPSENAGTGDPSSTSGISARHVELPDPNGLTAGLGELAGQIRDEFGGPVAGVRVSLRDTDNFTDSDKNGKFSIKRLTPATYEVRFEKEGFRSRQVREPVAAGNLTWIEVLLEAATAIERNDRPHPHDDWGPDTKKLLFAGPVPLGDRRSWTLPNDKVVLPGTKEIEVTATWTDTSTYSTIGLAFADNHDTVNDSKLYPRGPGEAFHILTNQEMTDAGHQKYSTWRPFTFYVPPDDGQGSLKAASFVPEYVQPPTAQVEVWVKKGIVAPGERHPDRWGGKDFVTVLSEGAVTISFPGPYPSNAIGFVLTGPVEYNESIQPTERVPPETAWVEVTLRQTRAMSPQTPDWLLSYKGATSQACASADAKGLGGPTSSDASTRTWTYRFRPGDKDPDPFYARATSWCFWIAPSDSDAVFQDDIVSQEALLIEVTAVAHKDPMPSS